MYSVIGIESFKGSFRRSCYLQSILGEPETALPTPCGGYIDPDTLQPVGFIRSDGSHGVVKGYICPLAQTCKVLTSNLAFMCSHQFSHRKDQIRMAISKVTTIFFTLPSK
jgi:hypothetical protein